MIGMLLSVLIPSLVQEAEKFFGGGTGAQKHAWVTKIVHEIVDALAGVMPFWLSPSKLALENLIDTLIEKAVNKYFPHA